MISNTRIFVSSEARKNVMDVLESGNLAQGAKVKDLEEKFANYCGTKYAVAVNSGTAALHSALYALNIKEGDEVITVPFTFVASANCIVMCGAKPIFVDVDENTFNIDPSLIEKKITKNTKAILPIDLYGRVYDHKPINKIAEKHNLKIVEDACQAHGAMISNKKAGSFGDAGCFSFYATKNMMCGEGGIVTTNNSRTAELVRRFRHHGQSEKTRYEYHDLGYNYRMTDVLATIAISELKDLDRNNKKRIANAQKLIDGLKEVEGLVLPEVLDIEKGNVHVFHQFTIKLNGFKVSRDKLIKILKDNDIIAGIYYPKPLHLHPYFANMGYRKGDFPISEKLSEQVLSLPVHPLLTDNEMKKIVDVIKSI